MPVLEFVLRFTLSHPSVHTAIIGAANPEHIKANCRISDGRPLRDADVQKAREIFTSYGADKGDSPALLRPFGSSAPVR
jgi:aryl-alcohol dehydrogenase-like predicted oxidoreductase